VGRTLLLNSNLFHIVGVLPERESIPSETQVWVTPRFAAPEYVEDQRASNAEVSGSYGRHSLMALGRMRDGATIAETRAELNMIGKRIAAAHANSQGHYANLTPLHERLVGDIKPALWVLLGAVVLLLLIACANMAGLLISRSASRTRELAVRAALGASRGQIGRLVLTESFLLAIAGGAFGILLADQGQRLLAKYSPYDLPSALGPQMDFEVLAFCVAATLLSALLSGLVPALRSANADVQDGLKESAKGSSSGSANRLRRLLVTAEIALSVVLLCGASLLIHSFVKILDVQPGFDTTNVITARISLPSTRYSKANAAVFWDKLLKHVSALPGVESAAIQTALPMSGSNTSSFIRVSGRGTNSDQLGVSGGVFDALRIPLLSGRNFDGRETGKALPVAVVNRAFAEKVFPNQNPIGRKFDGGPVDGVTRVIGVVGDIRYDGLREPAPPMMYFSYLQYAVDSASLVVRTRQNSSGLANELRAVLHSLDAELPLGSVKPLADYVNGSLATRRFLLGLLSAFAALAILLAAIGLYGVLAFSVEQRTREIGIRVALGAARRQVLGSVFRECSVVAMAGLATGLCGALWASSLLKAFLYGVSGADYLSYVTAAYLVLIIAALAALFPALRAIRVGPATALRYE
jgi:putative ABC transport system permease protein